MISYSTDYSVCYDFDKKMSEKNQNKKEENELFDSEHEDIFLDTINGLDDSVVAEENQINTIKKLREKLKATELEKQEYLSGWQRAKADFVNLRKQDEEDKQRTLKFAKESLILDIIPTLDSFELAFGNKDSWEKVDKEWRQGMESLYQKLTNTLNYHGVSKNDSVGKKFDPNRHEAMQTVAVNEKEKDNVVISVLQAGYELEGKVIRPARVVVGEYRGK